LLESVVNEIIFRIDRTEPTEALIRKSDIDPGHFQAWITPQALSDGFEQPIKRDHLGQCPQPMRSAASAIS
jgi:hypothetical protein